MVKIQERKILTQEQVRYFFDYQNGQLLWKNILKFSHVKIGQIAGGITDDKRCIIGLYGTTFYASRLIFCWHHGYMPEYIDHIDRDTLNNDISNLREATSSQNQANKTKSDNKTSAYKGVSFTTITNLEGKKYEYWTSLIYIEGKSKYLGSFKSQEHAALRYNKEAVKIFGEFAHLNIIQP